MIVLIDNGHGANTPGKCSPDKRLREYKYCRETAEALCKALAEQGYEARRIVTEETDVPLATRCKRVNDVCAAMGSKNVLLVSLHNNAAGNGGWKSASGWSGWVYTQGSAQPPAGPIPVQGRREARAARQPQRAGMQILDGELLHPEAHRLRCRADREPIPGQQGRCGLPVERRGPQNHR